MKSRDGSSLDQKSNSSSSFSLHKTRLENLVKISRGVNLMVRGSYGLKSASILTLNTGDFFRLDPSLLKKNTGGWGGGGICTIARTETKLPSCTDWDRFKPQQVLK